jgi:hypothetical protein
MHRTLQPRPRRELPRGGDLRGAMQMGAEGEVLPSAYDLSIVQRKIAGFWEPPAGSEQQPGEVAAIYSHELSAPAEAR